MIDNQIDYNKLDLDFDILEKAQNGDDIAQLKIGKALFNDGSYTKATDWIFQSAEQGNMEAQFRLADLYALGQGTQRNQVDAYQWYTKAALQGYKKALIRIHNLYQQDKRMYCRGQLNSSEEKWADENFKKEHNIRELNEYRREQHAPILNNAVDYYTRQFKYYKSPKEENIESDLNLAFLYQYGYGTRKNMILAFDFYRKAAEKGHKDAQYGLAFLYQTSPGIKFHYRLALRWYRASAINGNISAQNCLAYFYEKGLATELSYEGAFYWYAKAANAGSSSAQLTLGKFYRKGQGVKKNISEAIKWYKLAAYQGNNAAQNCLNQLYLAEKIPSNSVSQQIVFTLRSKLQKDIIDLNDSVHINKLKTLAQHAFMTDGNAMYQIGLKYYNGEDFPQDKNIGLQWIKKAAKAGIIEAELKIAKMYEDGDSVEQDYHKSSIWTIKSVKKRNDIALLKLGILYKNGLGVRKDPLEASKWFMVSANRGNTHGQFQFGLLRYNGEGVREDKEEASEILYELALLGNADALYQLGLMYEIADFGERDLRKEIKTYKSTLTVEEYKATEIIKMYKLSARLKNQDAQFRLARIYEEGKLTKKDLVKAHEYYTMAGNSDNPQYQSELALKYINSKAGDIDYIKAYDLLKKAAEKNEPKAVSIFQTPIQPSDNITNYSKVIEMFILASLRGVKGIQYNIGYAYEHGISLKEEIKFNKNYTEAKRWYSLAAKMGDYRAKYRLEVIYEKGERNKKYLNIAFCSYSLAFENGNSDVAYNLALMYQRGTYLKKDFIKAFNLFTAASNMGHKEGHEKLLLSENSENMDMLEAVASSGNVAIQYQLGIYFENKNDSKSIEWLTMAAEGGVNDAHYQLGALYEEGRNRPTDYSKAVLFYQKTAEKDHEHALYRLAQIYHHGKGTKRDYLKAYGLYARAANLGHISAFKIINLNWKQSVPSDEKENKNLFYFSSDDLSSILSMLKFVATQGNTELQFKLGHFYENDEINQSYLEALKWYSMAAGNNHTDAIYRLGLFYENGLGVEKDYNMSIQLYNKATDQGSHYALHRLGIAFHYGIGVDQDPTEAVDCYTKAAKLGNCESQHKLGTLYEKGELVEENFMTALAWYTEAYTNGNVAVIPNLYSLYDDKSHKRFGQRLFQSLSRFEKPENPNTTRHQINYGFIYYRLGKMYLTGLGTKKNGAEALKRFLIAENQYGYSDAKPFTETVYDRDRETKDEYIQRMKSYFKIKNTLDSEQQYRIGMIYYEEMKCYYEEDPTKKNKTDSSLVSSKEDTTAYEYLLLAAKNNHNKAQYQLGMMHLLGFGVQQSEMIAMKWITKFAESIEPKQSYKLGMDFYNGNETVQSYKISLIFIKQAIKENITEAHDLLRNMYFQGLEFERNRDEVLKWLDELIKDMDSKECYKQGMLFFYQGVDDNKVYELSYRYIKKAAEEGYKRAQFQLGMMYFHGRGVQHNYEEAMNWIQKSIKELDSKECYNRGMEFHAYKSYKIAFLYIKKAVKDGYDDARFRLALLYLQGYGTGKNNEEENSWIQKFINEMNSEDCYKLGIELHQNAGLNDKNIASIYIKKAAEDNYEEAQFQLGFMYLNGYGIEQNNEEGNIWIRRSINELDPKNCYKRGVFYYRKAESIEYNPNLKSSYYKIAFIHIKKAAEDNHEDAQFQLGFMYSNGYGIEQNNEEASKWIRRSINELDSRYCYRQGTELLQEAELNKKYEIPFVYIKKAAEDGVRGAQIILGFMYLRGHGTEKNKEKGNNWIQRSTSNMDSNDCYKQGMAFYKGTEGRISYLNAYVCLKTAAKKNHGDAQAQLGLMHLNGRGAKKNIDEAIKWFKVSTKNMSPSKCYSYGIYFFDDTEIDEHYKYSLIYLKKAAEKGHIYSQAQLAHMYFHGYGVNQDSEEATEWYNRATIEDQNHPAYKVGHIYHCGSSGVQDFSKALEWYRRESEPKNISFANRSIGLIFEYGHGVSQDYQKAFEYYTRSSDSNNMGSLYNLGLLYYYGKGVVREYAAAFSFFTRVIEASSNSDEMYVFIENINADSKNDSTEPTHYKHSLVTSDKICGEAHYYLGLMYKNGQGRDRSEKEARIHFEESFELGVQRAGKFLLSSGLE